MIGRTMVRWRVGIGYFPFFFEVRGLVRAPVVDFFAAFLGAVFLATAFALGAAALAAVFVPALALVARDGAECFASASSFSAIGVIDSPIAPDSINTTSDHRRW